MISRKALQVFTCLLVAQHLQAYPNQRTINEPVFEIPSSDAIPNLIISRSSVYETPTSVFVSAGDKGPTSSHDDSAGLSEPEGSIAILGDVSDVYLLPGYQNGIYQTPTGDFSPGEDQTGGSPDEGSLGTVHDPVPGSETENVTSDTGSKIVDSSGTVSAAKEPDTINIEDSITPVTEVALHDIASEIPLSDGNLQETGDDGGAISLTFPDDVIEHLSDVAADVKPIGDEVTSAVIDGNVAINYTVIQEGIDQADDSQGQVGDLDILSVPEAISSTSSKPTDILQDVLKQPEGYSYLKPETEFTVGGGSSGTLTNGGQVGGLDAIPEVSVADDIPVVNGVETIPEVSHDIPEISVVDTIPEVSNDIPEISVVDTILEVSDDIPEISVVDTIPEISVVDTIPEVEAVGTISEAEAGDIDTEVTIVEETVQEEGKESDVGGISSAINEEDKDVADEVLLAVDEAPSDPAPSDDTAQENGYSYRRPNRQFFIRQRAIPALLSS